MEFALLLPLLVLCVCVLCTTLWVCLETLRLNDTARLIARAVATSDDPQTTANNLAPRFTTVQVNTEEETQIVSVHLTQKLRFPFIGSALPALRIQATTHILYEPAPVFR